VTGITKRSIPLFAYGLCPDAGNQPVSGNSCIPGRFVPKSA
jgi:hypothetical protein